MSTDTQVEQVVLNKLTKAQFDTATKSATELYMVTDAKQEISDVDGLQTALNAKQDALPSGTTGTYLQKTASGVQWSAVEALPSQSGQSGKFLKTNGTSASWDTVTATTITYWE